MDECKKKNTWREHRRVICKLFCHVETKWQTSEEAKLIEDRDERLADFALPGNVDSGGGRQQDAGGLFERGP